MQKKIYKPYIIAETACSHDGSLTRLKKMVNAVNDSSCSAIQFQIWKATNMVIRTSKNLKKMKKIELSFEKWKKIFVYTKRNFPNLEIIACVYDIETLKFANKLGANAFKIHSSDLGNKELLNEVSKYKKRIDLSIGGSDLKEIKEALNILRKNHVWLMYGIQSFPTDPKDIQLKKIQLYSKIFNLNVGYQDHSPPNILGYILPAVAIGLGINIIEKHITDTRKRKGTDLESALDFNEYKNFVNFLNQSYSSLKSTNLLKLNKVEKKYRLYSKKKIFLKNNLNKNHILKTNDLLIRQPINNKGISVDNLDRIIGKKLIIDMKKYSLLEMKNLK